jgi:DNA-binding NarL/FixJ family response regulator
MSSRKGGTVAERISEREAEVLTALGVRLSNAQIANRLHISVRTVESHVSSLLRKYGMADRWALAELARSDVGEPAGSGRLGPPPPGPRRHAHRECP